MDARIYKTLLCLCCLLACMCFGNSIPAVAHSTQHKDDAQRGTAASAHPTARVPVATAQRGPLRRPPRLRALENTDMHPDGAVHHRWPQPPFVVTDAVVTGVASADEARALATFLSGTAESATGAEAPVEAGAGGRRALLHGRRRASAYSRCPNCTVVRCFNRERADGSLCSGHCRQAGRLFTCTTAGRVAGTCDTGEEDRPDPYTVPADELQPLESAVVSATAPFIGCANITNAANGCPDPGTTGMISGRRVEVLASTCVQHLYSLPCVDEVNATPFFPFGYCECLLEFESVIGMLRRPCDLSILEWSGTDAGTDGAGGTSEVPVRVSFDPQRNATITDFAEREEVDPSTYRFQHVFNNGTTAAPVLRTVAVELIIYRAFPTQTITLTAEGPEGQEEHGVEAGGPEGQQEHGGEAGAAAQGPAAPALAPGTGTGPDIIL